MRSLLGGIAVLIATAGVPSADPILAVHLPGVRGVTDPRPRWKPPPTYPEAMRRKALEAQVALEVIVTRDGTVRLTPDTRCLVTRGNKPPKKRLQRYCGDFITEAQKSVRWWLFDPGEYDDQPVDALYTVLIEFQLIQSLD